MAAITKRSNAPPKSRLKEAVLALLVIAGLFHLYRSGIRDEEEIVTSNSGVLTTAVESDGTQQGVKVGGTVVQKKKKDPNVHEVAGLSCEKYGGPPDEIAAEMVYWRDIPSDAKFVSPYKKAGPEVKYLTFEPDEGGWNNLRMSMETAVGMAVAMGRILVLPPVQGIYLLDKKDKNQKNKFSFADFFHFRSVELEHAGVDVITFEEFLTREGITGNLRDKHTGEVSFPPENRTAWDGMDRWGGQKQQLQDWTRNVTNNPIWAFDVCVVGFPAEPGAEAADALRKTLVTVWDEDIQEGPRINSYNGKPTPLDAPPKDRFREIISHRKKLCLFDEKIQESKVVHLMGDNKSGARLLVHFYAFLFFENWKHDLWMKRFIRDHLRYVDEIQCAAARVVNAMREKSRENGHGGIYDSFHIRRGDFQYKDTRVEPDVIFKNSQDVLVPNSTIYIATDERDKKFFDIFRQNYHIYFLDDFAHLLEDVNTNYFGMLDQRVASRGRTFVGTYYSTFTGYINRMRGYHSQLAKDEGYEMGIINSYYYIPDRFKNAVREYRSISPPMWAREFPVGWRELDNGMDFDQR